MKVIKFILIAVGVVVAISMCSVIVGGEDEPATSDYSSSAVTTKAPEAPAPAAPEEPQGGTERDNAVEKAADYLETIPMSQKGLEEQLVFEGFSQEDAAYAAANVDADWNEQAALKAVEYLEVSAFSKSALIDQLEFEGFTNEQATYGAESALG